MSEVSHRLRRLLQRIERRSSDGSLLRVVVACSAISPARGAAGIIFQPFDPMTLASDVRCI